MPAEPRMTIDSTVGTYTGGITWHASRDLLLGRQHKSGNRSVRWLDGRLDEVALYDVALDGATVQGHYDRGR
jgi:hypothetical protein